jgi:hypothetical protein
MSKNYAGPVDGWVPVKLCIDNNQLLARWLYVGNKDFTEPFFDETISACRAHLPENGRLKTSVSSIDVLEDFAKNIDSVTPAAFIFHVSRCGSTLISQMLGLQPTNIILSEVPFFDELLRYGKKHDCMTGMLPQLKAAVKLYGAKRNPYYQQLFIKTDSWHIHFYKELRDLYPTVPFFLLYRKPDEVLRSQQKKRGMHALPNFLEAGIFGFNPETISHLHFDEYTALVLESYFAAFANILQKDKNAHALNYHSGAMEMIQKIATVTGLTVTGAEKLLMQQRAGFHAKFPEQIFKEEKIQEPVPACLQKSFALYHTIEEVRLAGFKP